MQKHPGVGDSHLRVLSDDQGFWVMLMQETSEEVRLKVVQMIAGPVVECCGPQLSQHAADLASILQQALADPFHEIKKVTSLLHAGC